MKFLDQIIDESGIRTDPAKIQAITDMPQPQNTKDIRRFLGMVNQVRKFIPNLAEKTEPLRSLLSKNATWTWDAPQREAFKTIKSALISPPVLAHYELDRKTIVSADASSFGLGAVLLQEQQNGSLQPIVYASRSLTPTEQRYVQIEKEALALTWACERFTDYLLGLQFHIYTDHKPLVPLLSSAKRLDEVPPRIQRFRLRLCRFSFTISHMPGTQMYTPDTLSRAPLTNTAYASELSAEEVTSYSSACMDSLPASIDKMGEIRRGQEQDATCQLIKHYTLNGWP